MFPSWLHQLSIVMLVLGAISAGVVAFDVARHPQRMAVMNIVWPVTALFGTVASLWLYFRHGRKASIGNTGRGDVDGKVEVPFPIVVAKGAMHCGAGCMIGDVIAEWLAFLFPVVATWFGWHWLFADEMYAVWGLDFVFAFGLGIVFQYFAIVPMRELGWREGIIAAVKADALSLASWQVGMYGFMAFAQLYLFQHLLGLRAEVDTPEFWFAMQLAMLAGFVTAYPVNWWLIRVGIKEAM